MIRSDYKWLTEIFVAHRGLFDNNNGIPENSLPAFRRAVKNGFGIETDVQMSKDGVLVVFHDDTLDRMTGVHGTLTDYTFEELRKMRLVNTDCVIPTFEEFLQAANGVNLIVEIKAHGKPGEVEQKTRDALLGYKGNYCIESFDPFIVRWFKVNAPEVIRGQLSCDHKGSHLTPFKRWLAANLKLCNWNGSQFIAYDVNTLANVKAVAKYSKKIPIIAWTVKNQQQYEEAKPFIDNMIFDSFVPDQKSIDEQKERNN